MYLYKSDEGYTKASRNLGTSWSGRKYFTAIDQFMENCKDIYKKKYDNAINKVMATLGLEP